MGTYGELARYYKNLAEASARRTAEAGLVDVYRLRAQRVDQYWQSIARIINIGQTLFNAMIGEYEQKQQMAQMDKLYNKYAKLIGGGQ